MEINHSEIILVLNKVFNTEIIHAKWQTKELQGGTIGYVNLVTGEAENNKNEKYPFNVVLKVDKERHIDKSNRWRREYDLFKLNFNKIFSDTLRVPKCYHAELNNGEVKIWMEYINGISGNELTIDMLEKTVMELGHFQGRTFIQKPNILQDYTLFHECGLDAIKHEYSQWKFEAIEYIRSSDCQIPSHLRQMLINVDNDIEIIFENIKKLPVVFCHRDFWIENIFYLEGKIILIDWDFTGWGYLGEDIASLIVDDTDVNFFNEYYNRFVPAYYKAISEYIDISKIKYYYIKEMILIKFGFRFVNYYIHSESSEYKEQQINKLQKIYEIK